MSRLPAPQPPASSADACPLPNAQLTVYYDGACPVCSREIAHYRQQPGAQACQWVDAAHCPPDALGAGLSRAQALGRFHVRLADGRLVDGAAGFGALWQVMPGWRWLALLGILGTCLYNALTYLDEVHAVGLYGATGAGVAERDGVLDGIDIVECTLGKAIGVMGGYIAADAVIIDAVRSWASGFIFTTSLPPALTAGALASVRHLKTHPELRDAHQERAATLKARFKAAGIPVMDSVSHIVPVFVGNPVHAKMISDMLLEEHGVYVQPINYPTVPKGTERLRFTPSPNHTDAMMDDLVRAMDALWTHCNVARLPAVA